METEYRAVSGPEGADPRLWEGSLKSRIQVCRDLITGSEELLESTRELRRMSIGLLWPEGIVYRCMMSIPQKRVVRRLTLEDIGACRAEARSRLERAHVQAAESRDLVANSKVLIRLSRMAIDRQADVSTTR